MKEIGYLIFFIACFLIGGSIGAFDAGNTEAGVALIGAGALIMGGAVKLFLQSDN